MAFDHSVNYTLDKMREVFCEDMNDKAWDELLGHIKKDKMNKGKIICLVGLARSGKSSYCKQMRYNELESPTHIQPKVVVNSDEVRLAIHGQRYNRLAEPVVHSTTVIMARTFFNMGYLVYLDETNSTVNSIKQWLEIDSDLEFVYFDTSVEECERRARCSGQADLVENGVIRRHAQNVINLVKQYHPHGHRDLNKEWFLNKDIVMESLEEIRREFKSQEE